MAEKSWVMEQRETESAQERRRVRAERLRAAVAQWSRETNVHGPSYVLHAQSLASRVAWIACIVVCAVVMVPSLTTECPLFSVLISKLL